MGSTVAIYDLIVLGVILLACIFGWRRGLATQVASIVSIVASFMVAVRFREPVAAWIDAAEPWNRFAAMLVLYLGTSLLIWLFFRQVRTSIERMKLREFDRQLGAVFGAVKGLALASLGTLFAFTLLEDPQREEIIHSRTGVWIARLLNSSTAIMPPEVQEFLGPYLERLEEGFGSEGGLERLALPGGSQELPLGPWGTGSEAVARQPVLPPPLAPGQPGYEYRPVQDDWRTGGSRDGGYR